MKTFRQLNEEIKLSENKIAATEEYDIESMLEYIEELEAALELTVDESLTSQMGSELGAKFGAKTVSSADKKKSLADKIAASKAAGATGNSTAFGGASRNKPFSYGSKID